MPKFAVAARYEVPSEHLAKVVELLASVRTHTLQELGCLSYEPHRSDVDPNVLFIIEQYEAAEDFDHHCSTPHFKEIVLGEIVPLLRGRTVIKGSPLF